MRPQLFPTFVVLWALLCPLAYRYSSADSKKDETAKQTCRAYTPKVGSAERKAILKTLHASYKRRFGSKKTAGKSIYYVVQHLKVCGGWAWIETEPRSDGKKLENAPCAALLRKKNQKWIAVETWLLEEPGIDRAVMKSHYPEAPVEIFS